MWSVRKRESLPPKIALPLPATWPRLCSGHLFTLSEAEGQVGALLLLLVILNGVKNLSWGLAPLSVPPCLLASPHSRQRACLPRRSFSVGGSGAKNLSSPFAFLECGLS